MKICVSIILLFLFFVLGLSTKIVDASYVDSCSTCVSISEDNHIDRTVSNILNGDDSNLMRDVESADAHTLAYRLCLSAQRLNRLYSFESSYFIRTLLRNMAIRLSHLSNGIIHKKYVFCTLSWMLPSEHYVFGLRRILL